MSTKKTKKNAPMGHIGACGVDPLLAALTLVPVPGAQLLVLVLAHLLPALLDDASHRPSG